MNESRHDYIKDKVKLGVAHTNHANKKIHDAIRMLSDVMTILKPCVVEIDSLYSDGLLDDRAYDTINTLYDSLRDVKAVLDRACSDEY